MINAKNYQHLINTKLEEKSYFGKFWKNFRLSRYSPLAPDNLNFEGKRKEVWPGSMRTYHKTQLSWKYFLPSRWDECEWSRLWLEGGVRSPQQCFHHNFREIPVAQCWVWKKLRVACELFHFRKYKLLIKPLFYRNARDIVDIIARFVMKLVSFFVICVFCFNFIPTQEVFNCKMLWSTLKEWQCRSSNNFNFRLY